MRKAESRREALTTQSKNFGLPIHEIDNQRHLAIPKRPRHNSFQPVGLLALRRLSVAPHGCKEQNREARIIVRGNHKFL
jgi:hypothetical protein